MQHIHTLVLMGNLGAFIVLFCLLVEINCVSAYECNFDKSMCSFVQDKNDIFDWTRINGSTPTYGTGPSADHTGNGYYMYIETSSPRQQGDNAKLNSPKLRFAGNMCLKFYYHMYGADIATLNVIINGNKVFTASGDKGSKWLRAAVDVHLSGMYSVVFEGIRGSSFEGDIAIDDFGLDPWSCSTRYVEQVVTSSRKLRFSGNMCLMFSYRMYRAAQAILNVIINGNKVFTASGDKGDKWLRAAVDVHVSGMYSIVIQRTWESSFAGDIAMDHFRLVQGSCSTISPSTPAATTLPTIPQVSPSTPGATSLPTIPQAYECNFDKSMCSFVQDKNDVFDWTRINGSTPTYGTGPSADHTGNGYYMYIETSSPRQQGDNAKLNSPKLRFAGNMCLMFYYHMHGADIATLNAIINEKKVFTASGDKGNKWLRAAVDVHVSGVYSIVFEGIRGSSFQGDTAIDDFRLAPGSCSTISPSTPAATSLPTIPQGSCGIRFQTRIVGGTNARQGNWPWQVWLGVRYSFLPGIVFRCGGTLIYPQWVLTAAHCVIYKGHSPSSIVIRAGEYNTSGVDGTEQDIKVVKVITHQSYGNPVRYSNDIALLKLERNATLNSYVNLVCLPFSVTEPTDGTKCWITGWGKLAFNGATPNILQQAQVPIVNRTRCDKAYPGQIDDSMICAGLDQGGIDTCQGDSGGPMMCETGGKFYIHGVTSFGDKCAQPGKFGVYAKVKHLLSWLNHALSNN